MRGFLNSKANIRVDPNEPGLVCGLDMKQDIAGTVFDKSGNGNDGTLVGNPRQGCDSLGHYLNCDGSADSLEQGNVGTIKTILMWIDPESTTEDLADLDGGTHTLEITTGTLTATGFVAPTLYVNGQTGSTVVANLKQLIVVTTATGIAASAFDVGLLNGKQYPAAVYADVKDAAWAAQQYALGKRALWMTQPVNNTGTVTSGHIGDSPFKVDSGGFAVVDDAEVGKAIECITAGTMYAPTLLFRQSPKESAYGEWEFTIYHTGTPFILFTANVIGGPVETGQDSYDLFLLSDGSIRFRKNISASATNLFVTAAGIAPVGAWHTFKVIRTPDGDFSVYLNKELILVSSGANPVTDTAITEALYVTFDLDAGDKIAIGNQSGNYSVIKRLLP